MVVSSILSISCGAATGALVRWWLGTTLNSIFPTIPLGTLSANLVGGLLVGMFMAMTQSHMFVSETARLTIATGFLGGLTTFSTFSAEVVTLLSHTEYFWMTMLIVSHVGGSILSTIFGFYIVNFFLI